MPDRINDEAMRAAIAHFTARKQAERERMKQLYVVSYRDDVPYLKQNDYGNPKLDAIRIHLRDYKRELRVELQEINSLLTTCQQFKKRIAGLEALKQETEGTEQCQQTLI